MHAQYGGIFEAGVYNYETHYVPKGSLDSYKTATNWASFADKFVELS